MNKCGTCGECKNMLNRKVIGTCRFMGICTGDIPACGSFEQQPITNGDVIRQGGDDAVIAFAQSLNYSFPIPIENLTKGKYTDEECWEIYLKAKKKKYSQIKRFFSKSWAELRPDCLPIDVQVSFVTELHDGFQTWLRFEVIKNDEKSCLWCM